jgi:hypothetical protein
MRKKINLILIFFLICVPFTFTAKVLASVPLSNTMQLGEITSLLPAEEMRAYFQKMEPVYQQYFGPPFSNINLKIIASPESQTGDDGFSATSQTLEYGYMAKVYLEMAKKNPEEALKQLQGSMRHELSHGRYYWENELVHFDRQWMNEGWAKLYETLIDQKLNNYSEPIGNSMFFSYYLDKDAVAGTSSWGIQKIRMNHSLVYNMTTVTHFLLAAAGSSSNKILDFPKKFNEALYDYAVSNNLHKLTEVDVRKILDNLLPDTTIDGVKASDWYFQSPAAFSKGTTGYHIGVTTDNQTITAFIFNREYKTNSRNNDFSDYFDVAAPNVPVKIEVLDVDGKVVASGTAQTNQDGEASIAQPEFLGSRLYTFRASANLQSKNIEGQSYYYDIPPWPTTLSGIITDENGKAVDKRYVGLLTSENNLFYKDNGVFVAEVPEDQRTVVLNFLGFSQEVTKGSFQRIFFMKVPQSYLDKAAKLSDQELSVGLKTDERPRIDQNNLKESSMEKILIVCTGFLVMLFFGVITYLLKKGKISKVQMLLPAIFSSLMVIYTLNFIPKNIQIMASRSPLRKIADYSSNFVIFFIVFFLLFTLIIFVYKKILFWKSSRQK